MDMELKTVFYTRPGYLDPAFSLVSRLAEQCEVHLIVEVAPEGRGIGAFALPAIDLPAGLIPAKALPGWLPSGVESRLRNLASFHLAVYRARRAFYPGNLVTAWRVARFVRSVRPDLLHFDEASSRAVVLPYLLHKVPLVLSIHDSHAHLGEASGRFDLVRAVFLRRARALIFHSRYSQETFPYLRKAISRHVQMAVVPLGVYDVFNDVTAGTVESIEPEAPTALFFGRISPYKGIEVLLAAAPLVAQQVRRFRLIIAGSPIPGYQVPAPPPLENGGCCEYRLKWIPLEEMAMLFAASYIVVLPYLEATQSGVVATAYALHKPVVATAVGGLPEMVEDGVTGRLVPPRDPKALAAGITELLLDAEKRHQMAEAIRRKQKSEWSWPRLATETVNVYRRVLVKD
jgi:glycosyltransferase involved in cell wall biosynthesis